MVKEEKFILNNETGEAIDIKSSDFEFVQQDSKIHDQKFNSKATTFFKDAMKRFVKSKSSIGGACIVGLLLVLAILVPACMPSNGCYNVAKDSAGGNVNERFMQPKLFKAGTGFWDGTIKKTKILYNTSTGLPNGYRESAVLEGTLSTYETYENTSNELGSGGYVNIACLDNSNVGTFYSKAYTFNFDENEYEFEMNTFKEELSGYKLSSYRVLLLASDSEGTTTSFYLSGDKSGSYIDDESFKVSSKDVSSLKGEISARIRVEVEPLKNDLGNVLISSFNVSSSNSEEKEALETISFKDGNTLGLRKNADAGFWATTTTKNIYKVKYTYCNFTYNQYEDVYGEQEKTYAASELYSLQNNGYFEFESKASTLAATTDKTELAKRFSFSSDSPIIEIVEQIGVATRGSNGKYSGFTLKCKVLGYRVYGYNKVPTFLFGTNSNRKDYLKLIFTGLRFSFLLAIGVSFVNILVGLIRGSISGYFGGWTDIVMERIVEIISGLPSTVIITLCIMYGSEFNRGSASDVIALMVALFMTGWMGVAGRTRTQFYRFKGREYVLASRTLGAKDSRLIFKHILPNSMGTIITGSILMIPSVIYTEASISYLGLGLQGQVMFGVILSEANSYYKGDNTFLLIIPTVIMAFLLISFNLFGNGLRDAFNPTLKGGE